MQLKQYLKKTAYTVTEVAEAWGISRIALQRAVNGQRWPSPLIMIKAHQFSAGKVGIMDWAKTCESLLAKGKQDGAEVRTDGRGIDEGQSAFRNTEA